MRILFDWPGAKRMGSQGSCEGGPFCATLRERRYSALVPDDAHGGFVHESAGRGEAARLIDLAPIDNPHRRLSLGRNRVKFNAPRDEGAGDENQLFVILLLRIAFLILRWVGKGDASHQHERDQYSDNRGERRLHDIIYSRTKTAQLGAANLPSRGGGCGRCLVGTHGGRALPISRG